jgi:hypothetical protein
MSHLASAFLASCCTWIAAAASAAAQSHPSQRADAWWKESFTFQSTYYDVRTDLGRPLAEELAHHMDDMFEHYGQVLSGLRERRSLRLELLLFQSPMDYGATLSQRYDARPAGTAGMCIQDRSRVTLAAWVGHQGTAAVKRTLQHEGFHQVARSLLGDIPLWADEGLAEICENGIMVDDRVMFGEIDAAHLATLRQAEAHDALIPLRELFKRENDDWTDSVNVGRGALLYAQAWSVVHFLLFAEDGRFQDEFDHFMSMLNTGQSWEGAFHRSFGTTDFDALEGSWREYVRRLQPTNLRDTLRRLEFLAEGMLALRARGIHPQSLDDLRTALREMGFSHQAQRLGDVVMLKASDDAVFTAPGAGEAAAAGAAFEVIDPSSSAGSDRGRSSDREPRSRPGRTRDTRANPSGDHGGAKSPPPPAIIATVGLLPLDLAVVWEVDAKSGAASYRLRVR